MSAIISTSNLLAVQEICAIMVCKSCKIGLPSERSGKTHLVEKHSYSPPKARSHAKKASDAAKAGISESHHFREYYLCAPDRAPNCDHNGSLSVPSILPPLESLEIVTGYQCTLCPSCYTSQKGMKDHFSEKHSDNQSGEQGLWDACISNGTMRLQTLFGGKKTRYFPVSTAAPLGEVLTAPVSPDTFEPDRITISDQFASHCSKPPLSNYPCSRHRSESTKELDSVLNAPAIQAKNTPNHSMNVFLARTKLDQHLQDLGYSMQQATAFSAFFSDRSPAENLVVEDVTEYLVKVPSMVPDISPSVLQDVNLRGFKEFTAVSKQSAERYARSFARIVISANRLQEQEFFPSHIRQKVSPYFSRLEKATENRADRLAFLHELLSSICFQKLDNIDSPRQLFLYQFITLASVVNKFKHSEENLRFVDASDISPVLAALLYGITSCALTEIYALGQQAKSVLTQSRAPSENSSLIRTKLNARLQDVLSSFDESKNCASSSVRKLLTVAHAVKKAEDVNFVFDLCQKHPICGIVNNVHINMCDLGKIVKSLHEDIRSKFSEQLFGASLPDEFYSDILAFQDTIHDKSAGFSFLNHPTNAAKVCNFSLWLFQQITQVRPSGKAAFSPSASTPASEQISMLGSTVRREAVQKWLANGKSIQEKLLPCLHISSGSPGRSTELETMTLYNTESHPRNVYISQGRLVFVTRYSKSRWLTGADKIIPRFPDQETSKLFLSYLVLFRPLESLFVKLLFGEEVMTNHMTALFTERGRPYSATRIRDIIRSTFHEHSLPIQYNHFRHFSAGIIPTVTQTSPVLLRDELISEHRAIAHLQAGHSPETAEASYARRSDDIPSLPTSALAKYRLFSLEWHRHMQLSMEHRQSNPQSDIISSTPSIQAPPNPLLTESVSQAVSITMKKEFQKFSTTLSHSNKRSLTNVTSSLSPPTKRAFPTRIRSPPERDSLHDLRTLLPSLRTLLNDENASFKSEMQLQITATVKESTDNLMVILPTGAGKTLTFLLPAAMEQSRSTVVFVPLAALVMEHVETCKSLGINVATWENRNDQAQVYIFSVDHSVQQVRSFLLKLQEHGRLRRVVIDEAHLLLMWFIFRSSVQRLPFALQACEHSVQLVLLTATLPPSHRERLLSFLSTHSVLLYAVPTVRENLRFTVIDSSPRTDQTRFIHHRTIMMNALWSLLLEMLEQLLEQDGGKVLIFTLYRHETENIQRELSELIHRKCNEAVPVQAYHAGMSPDNLKAIHRFWKQREPKVKIVVATSAFGTGLDVQDVRLVVHFGGSSGLLGYAQEAGRAGRDGKSAQCTIIYNKTYADEHTAKILSSKGPSSFSTECYVDEQTNEWELLREYMRQNRKCRKNYIYSLVDGSSSGMCLFNPASENCDVCDELLDTLNPNIMPYVSSQTLPSRNSFPIPNFGALTNELSSPQTIPVNSPDLGPLTPIPSQSPQNSSLLQAPLLQTPADLAPPLPVSRRLSFSNSSSPGTRHDLPITAPSSTNLLHEFRSACHSLQNLCIPCLVFDLKHELIEHRCSHMRRRCKRCFESGHQVSSCTTFNPKRKNFCYGCSMSQIQGENIHRSGEFGRNCFMGIARSIAWAYWRKDNTARELLAISLFQDIELTKLQQAESSSSPDRDSIEFYKIWLQTNWNGVPNLVRFLLWWKNALAKF